MAREFPDAQVRGIDKGAFHSRIVIHLSKRCTVPIMTRYPLDNVHFEIGDVREHLRIADASVDVVHARMSGLSVRVTSARPHVLTLISRAGCGLRILASAGSSHSTSGWPLHRGRVGRIPRAAPFSPSRGPACCRTSEYCSFLRGTQPKCQVRVFDPPFTLHELICRIVAVPLLSRSRYPL